MKVTFLGVGGGRFVSARQLTTTGGLFIEEGDSAICIDPGPGAVVQYARRQIDPARISAIMLSHRHLDHCAEVNVMIEAMTDGGFRPRGTLFCPADALDEDPVVLRYLRPTIPEIVRLQPHTDYQVGSIGFTTSGRHVHQVETYGFRFGRRLGWVVDTGMYEGLVQEHLADVMLIHTVLMDPHPHLPHLSVRDVELILSEARPRLAVLTHFGWQVWRSRPAEIAERMSQKLGIEVRAAYDGMTLEV